MVRAGQAFLGDLRQHATNDAAQRVVDESVVLKSIVHGLSEIQRKASARMAGESTLPIAGKSREGKWGASVARCPPDRAYVRCLGGSSECNGVIVSTCEWPVTAEPYRAKTAPLPRPSILVRPLGLRAERCGGEMVEAPGTAPGSETLISRGVYRHSRFPDILNIGASAGFLKAFRHAWNFPMEGLARRP
jgi:hypothetical protein